MVTLTKHKETKVRKQKLWREATVTGELKKKTYVNSVNVERGMSF